ncbi:RNA-directed DNA polymerase [Antricoccus suffuscus]|uniref:RNA-directed DNA polymerase n=1 Tax=Antricoccus suffuscus TaxID=1629062 RepID=A0A2T0YXZ5_9ACTN|nr:group II intron reverse transcriptase/maturase [Antricoccus suffuscus]PRZ28778.1 RNA-directed DNA polymerase [Antricoccus suffuscus]
MPEDTGVNVPVWWPSLETAGPQVRKIQTKLHQWATTEPGRRFDDLFNLVCDPATLMVAFARVAGNAGANTTGVDRISIGHVRDHVGLQVFLNDIRDRLRAREFRPLPVRERMIPKSGGKFRRLGIPTVTDRVVQAALKLVLEPIFEADFVPVSYGFRPNRRAHDAIAEIQAFGTRGYRWVLDADIEACFDRIDHAALMGRVRGRVKDKRVLALVKAFLKAGILTELGDYENTDTGTPQGGILSPLLANIALSVLDEHFDKQWRSWSKEHRVTRRRRGLGTWRIVRYADDFVVLVNGTRENVEQAREQATAVLEPMGLRLSEAKTQIVHMQDGFDFLGFRITWMRKRGTDKYYVYTFIAHTPVRELKRKIRALTRRLSGQEFGVTLIRINQILRGWANYFRHAVAKRTFSGLAAIVWHRVARWVMHRHRMSKKALRRRFHSQQGWKPLVLDGVALFDIASVTVTRYRWRGYRIPTPWTVINTTA